MTAIPRVKDLLTAIRAEGAKIWRDGAFIEVAAREPLPLDLIEHIRARKPELLAALADPSEKADWIARHIEVLAHWRALQSEAEATPGDYGCMSAMTGRSAVRHRRRRPIFTAPFRPDRSSPRACATSSSAAPR